MRHSISRYWPKIRIVLTVLVYAGLAVLVTWPLVAHITTLLPGTSDDVLVHYWNGWWVQQALGDGQNPLYSPYLFFPIGISLVTHNIAWFQVLPWLFLEPLLGGIAAFNLAILLNLTLCGCAVFWLSYRLTSHFGAAFLAGLVYLAWPFRLSQLDHPNLLATQWIPVFFLLLIYTLQRGRWRDAVLCGLLFALIGYTRWQLLIPATLMALAYVAWRTPKLLTSERHVAARLLAAGATAVILLLPPAWLLFSQLESDTMSSNLFREGEESVMQTDVLAYLTPPASNPFVGNQTQSLYDSYYADRSSSRRFPAYIGFTVLALAVLGLKFRSRRALPWLTMGILLILLALGPLLRINGRFFEYFPTLYQVLSPLGVVRLMRVPDRFNVTLALPISILAAYGATGVLERSRKSKRWLAAAVFASLTFLILVEYLMIPVSLQNPNAGPSVLADQLATLPGDSAVLNLPMDPLRSKIYMFEQTFHQRPIVQGKIARIPDDQYRYIDANPLLRSLRQINEFPPELTDVSRQLTRLNQDGVGYIILNKKLVGPDRVAHWRRYLLVKPLFEDESIAAYTTAPRAGRDFEIKEELSPGLGPVSILLAPGCLNPNSELAIDIGWGSSRPIKQDFEVELSLVNRDDGQILLSHRYPLVEGWATSQWPANSLAWGHYQLTLPGSLSPGSYDISIRLLASGSELSAGPSLLAQTVAVQTERCNYASLPSAVDSGALFGNALRLVEYELDQQEQSLNLNLYWQAERRMDIDYKIFVHVFDPETGVPVAQDDAMPRRGAYPTRFWWPGDKVDDKISISLAGVQSGTYGLAVGVYDPVSGRLSLIDDQGLLVEDGRLILVEAIAVR